LKFGEKKKNGERVPFYLLLVPVTHRGGWNRCGKKWRQAQSMAGRPTAAAAATEIKRGKNQKNRLDPWREKKDGAGKKKAPEKKSRKGGAMGSDAGLPIFMYKGTRFANC